MCLIKRDAAGITEQNDIAGQQRKTTGLTDIRYIAYKTRHLGAAESDAHDRRTDSYISVVALCDLACFEEEHPLQNRKECLPFLADRRFADLRNERRPNGNDCRRSHISGLCAVQGQAEISRHFGTAGWPIRFGFE